MWREWKHLTRILVSCLCALSCVSVHADEGHDPNAGCETYPWEMNREWSLMLTDPIPRLASLFADPEARNMPLDRRVLMKLHPKDQVKFQAAPEKAGKEGSYAGMLPIQLPYSKSYRISSTRPLWFDVVGPNGVVKSSKFAMALGCERLVKTVVFKLESDTVYWLQLSGSAQPEVEMILTLHR